MQQTKRIIKGLQNYNIKWYKMSKEEMIKERKRGGE
jgi:hypothetical protein